MCKAIEDMKKEQYEEGRRAGEASMCKAIEDMKKEQYEEGRRAGEEQGIFITLVSLVRGGMLKLEDAARQDSVSADEFLKKMQLYISGNKVTE